MQVLLLSASEVEQLLAPEALMEALAEEFKGLSVGAVSAPKRNEVTVANAGVLMAMPAFRPSREVTVKLVSVFHGNEAHGLPGHHALICLFDAQTGVPICVMDGTYITAQRTAGAAALATQLLARQDAHVLAIVGAGVQGEAHLKMVPRVRQFREIRIASQRFVTAERLAASDERARAVTTVEEAVRGADVVCLCTSASEPVIRREWLMPGAHVTSVGYQPPDGELDPSVAEQDHLFVETRLAFDAPPAGCGELTGLDPNLGAELGELLLGVRPGRQSDVEITVYKSMGHACEDMAAASLVYQRARQAGVGTTVAL
ncbi:MAG TPA: ornithine cyclodeaminase family protein [Ktedonobacterales bacterium]|jgi:ornithine cyclodeaminase/thiomorpholine-carboxylate dehydrogenase|nr:ornithine cyclodeaminase family protein [Ktedonobacterales bacterium]